MRNDRSFSEDCLMRKFYGIRCNAVHRGKAVEDDERILKKGFLLLFSIMTYVISSDLKNNCNAEQQFYDDIESALSILKSR